MAEPEIIIDIDNSTQLKIPTIEQFAKWTEQSINKDLTTKAKNITLSIKIASSNEIQQINNDYRNFNKATNILSFPFENPPGFPKDPSQFFLGDLVISPEVITKKAKEQGKKWLHHWTHITIHGILHLQGFDHIHAKDAEIMENLEIDLLAKLNIPNPYE